jgi:integrase
MKRFHESMCCAIFASTGILWKRFQEFDLAEDSRMLTGKLNARKVATARPGRYNDGGNLYLFVKSREARSWVFRYMIDGKPRWLGIGSIDTVSLDEARDKSRLLRAKVHRKPEDGGPVDVVAERRAAKEAQAQERRVEKAKAMTFEDCANGYLRANSNSWKNAKHRQQWVNTLKTYVFPVIGDLPIQRVDQSGIVKALTPIWHEKAETARRVRMRIETIIEWAISSKFFVGDNPAKRERLKYLLGAQTDVVKHMEALPYDDIGAFMDRLRKHEGIGSLPLEWTILTACRTGEARGATWEEIDLIKDKVWVVPAVRRKGKPGKVVDLVVPLSDRCIEILKTLEPIATTGLIFRGNKGRRLSENTLLSTLEQLECPVTTHGFRSTFNDWAGDRTNFARDVIQMALGHKIGDGVEQAYRRGTAVEKRRKLMQAWARYCGTPTASKGNNVVAIGAGT